MSNEFVTTPRARAVYRRFLGPANVALCILILLAAAAAQNPAPTPTPAASLPDAPSVTVDRKASSPVDHALTLKQRLRLYSLSMISPDTILRPALGAGIEQWENEPPEWGQGAEGYGKRFASDAARYAIGKTLRHGFAALDGEDPRYFLSEDTRTWPRIKHAVVETMTAQTASGRRIPAYSRFIGEYGSAFISNEWYPEFPENRATAGDAAVRGTKTLLASIGYNVLYEFLPRKIRNLDKKIK